MPIVRDRAICLRRLDYSETSQILAIYAREHGLLRVIAKGAKRTTKAGAGKFDGGLDLLDLGDAVFIHQPEKDMSTLTEWALMEGHLAIRESLRALYLGQYAAELIMMLFEEHDPHPDVFDDLVALVPMLGGERGDRAEEAFLAFELRLYQAAGVLPELSRCTSCGRVVDDAPPGFFSPGRGGVVCRDCESAGAATDRMSVDPRLLRMLRTMAGVVLPRTYTATPPAFESLRLPRLTRLQTDPLNRLLIAHLRHVTQRDPRLGAYVVGPGSGGVGGAAGSGGSGGWGRAGRGERGEGSRGGSAGRGGATAAARPGERATTEVGQVAGRVPGGGPVDGGRNGRGSGGGEQGDGEAVGGHPRIRPGSALNSPAPDASDPPPNVEPVVESLVEPARPEAQGTPPKPAAVDAAAGQITAGGPDAARPVAEPVLVRTGTGADPA